VIFPGADVKIYLDASPEERARRRCQELTAAGRQVDLQETLREIEERDQRDRGRDIAPLCKAADALLVDSSSVDAEQVAALVLNQIKNKAREN
jgi:cytidylate kinase